ncbi:MAG: GNAT family N-acetyltransferase [Sporolactobacillus sp.]|nr:GNAT family N-acetyltransferase [Sporolactobacillus sp.]
MFLHKIDDELSLKLIDLSDAEPIFKLTEASRPYLREWLPWPDETKTVGDSRGFILEAQRGYSENRNLTTVVLFRGKIIGVIAFNTLDWTNKKTDIGYWLGENFQGHGLMTRAARALTDYGFRGLGLHRVEIRAATGNRKSRAIPERLGFRQEGCLREAEWIHNHYVDHVVYSMLEQEWK